MNLIKEKNAIFKKCMKTNSEVNWSEYKNSKLIHIKESAKSQYFQNMIKENKNNMAKLWKARNDICNR